MPPRASKTSVRGKVAGKRYPLNIRTTVEIRRYLESAAQSSGRSLAQEAELRIERSFHDQKLMIEALALTYGPELAAILQMMGEVMKLRGQDAAFKATTTLEGAQNWWSNPYAFAQAKLAAEDLLDKIKPAGDPSPPSVTVPMNTISDAIPAAPDPLGGYANAILEEASTGHSSNSGGIERARRLHRAAFGTGVAERIAKFADPEFRAAKSHLGDDQ
jgi:hypothetical protein